MVVRGHSVPFDNNVAQTKLPALDVCITPQRQHALAAAGNTRPIRSAGGSSLRGVWTSWWQGHQHVRMLGSPINAFVSKRSRAAQALPFRAIRSHFISPRSRGRTRTNWNGGSAIARNATSSAIRIRPSTWPPSISRSFEGGTRSWREHRTLLVYASCAARHMRMWTSPGHTVVPRVG